MLAGGHRAGSVDHHRGRWILLALVAAAAVLVAVLVSSSGPTVESDPAAVPGEPAAAVPGEPAGCAPGACPPPPQRIHQPSCDERLSSAEAARGAVEAASGGEVVCLEAGRYEDVDVTGIDKPAGDPVTLRGAADRATSVRQISFGGSSGLVIEGFRVRRGIDSANQEVTQDITIRLNDIGGTEGQPNVDAIAIQGIGDWSSAGQHDYLVERNYIHDTSGYGIDALGNAPGWTVRYNKFERIGDADYIQTGFPADWVVDHNWFLGPSFRTTEDAHPDLWQSLDPNPPGTSISFTNNRVHETDGVTLGFVFGDVNEDEGSYHDIRIDNNLMNRMADGEACQLSNTIGLTFTHNTVRAGANGWACRLGEEAEDQASGYTIQRNVLTESEVSDPGGPDHLTCGPDSESCDAVESGSAMNVSDDGSAEGAGSIRGWKPRWSSDGWFRAEGLRFSAGHSLKPAQFGGWPFPPDTNPPQTKITKDPPRRARKQQLKFKFKSDEPDAGFECRVDSKRFKRCSSPRRVKRLGPDGHTFEVRAVDSSGNVDPSPARDRFTVGR